MAPTSNQETFRAEGLEGRLVFDVLRQILSQQMLTTFSLADCAASLLKETLEARGHATQTPLLAAPPLLCYRRCLHAACCTHQPLKPSPQS